MKKVSLLLVAVAMLTSASGCYCGYNGCWPSLWGRSYGPSNYGGYGGGCPGGNCGAAPGVTPLGVPPGTYLPPQGAYQSYDSIQAGYPVSATPGPVAIGPIVEPAGNPQTAFAPLNPLPTY